MFTGIGLSLTGGGAGGASVLPQSANIVFKLSADSLTLADNAVVDTWTDSVNGVSATATSTARPTFKTNVVGTKPAVRFNGTTNVMQLGRPAALTAAVDSTVATTIIVCKVNGATSNGVIFGAFSAGGVGYIADGTNLGRFSNFVYPSSAATISVIGSTTQTLPAWATFGTGIERAYINGSCVLNNTAPAATSGGFNFGIGARADLANYANADVFDIIVWNTALTPAEMLSVQKWICDKYAQPYPWASASYFTVFDGDSITAGVGRTTSTGSYPSQAATTMGLTLGQWTNVGIQGVQMRNMATKSAEFGGISGVISKPVRVAGFEYYNEKATAPATLQGYTTTYASTVRGYSNTKLALGSSTSSTSDPDANRTTYNDWLTANSASLCDAFVSIHTNTPIGISGAAATDANVTYFSDGIHLKNAGYAVLSGLMATGVQAIP